MQISGRVKAKVLVATSSRKYMAVYRRPIELHFTLYALCVARFDAGFGVVIIDMERTRAIDCSLYSEKTTLYYS
jgi:hypothetical protein